MSANIVESLQIFSKNLVEYCTTITNNELLKVCNIMQDNLMKFYDVLHVATHATNIPVQNTNFMPIVPYKSNIYNSTETTNGSYEKEVLTFSSDSNSDLQVILHTNIKRVKTSTNLNTQNHIISISNVYMQLLPLNNNLCTTVVIHNAITHADKMFYYTTTNYNKQSLYKFRKNNCVYYICNNQILYEIVNKKMLVAINNNKIQTWC